MLTKLTERNAKSSTARGLLYEGYSFVIMTRKELCLDNVLVLGSLMCSDKGWLVLTDGDGVTGAVRLIVEHKEGTPIGDGKSEIKEGLCWIIEYDFICETVTDSAGAILPIVYLRCSVESLIHIKKDDEGAVLVSAAASNTCVDELGLERVSLLFYLEHLVPATARLESENRCRLVAGIEGTAWKVKEEILPVENLGVRSFLGQSVRF